jgi:ankyrin repeat protein
MNSKMELIFACRNGDLSSVQELIADLEGNGLDVNYKDEEEFTALLWACWKSNREIVLVLMSVQGLGVNLRTNCNLDIALLMACVKVCNVDNLLKNLLGSIMIEEDGDGFTALMLACYRSNAHIALDLLLDRRVDRHISDRNGGTALDIARLRNLTAVVTRIEDMDRGDARMPMVLVHHRYMYADSDTNDGLHPPESAIAQALVIRGIVELICRYIA